MSEIRPLHKREKVPLMESGELHAEIPSVLEYIRFKGRLNVFGAYSYGNINVAISQSDVGRFCSIGQDVLIGLSEHPLDRMSSHCFTFNDMGTFRYSPQYREIVSPIDLELNERRTSIGNDVWIGARAIIRRGVRIGHGAVVGAGSIVTKDVEPYTVVAGAPAISIKQRFDDAIVERLLEVKWWNYNLRQKDLPGIDYRNVPGSITQIEEAVAEGRVKLLAPRLARFINGECVA